jgi:hypothetical protein
MALVQVNSVRLVGENPAPISAPFKFAINYECLEELKDGLREFFLRE